MVKKSIDVKVRPLANTSLEKASLLGAARIYVSKDSLLSLTGTLENGKLCVVERLDDAEPQTGALRRDALLYILPEKNLSPNVVMMTRAFQEAAGFKLGDQVRISILGETPDAGEVVVEDVTEGEADDLKSRYIPSWEHSISISLDRAKEVFPGMVLEGVNINKLRRTFKVVSVNSRTDNLARNQLSSTSIRITQPGQESDSHEGLRGGDLVVTSVPGLSAQVEILNDFLDGFTGPFVIRDERESCGFVIHGGQGTGKTFILQRIAETKWGRPYWIKPSDKLSAIRETFSQARAQQPSMVFIEGLGDLIGKDRSNRDSVIETIGEELDSLSAEAKANQALPRVVVVATCSDYMVDVPAKLQKRSRFRGHTALPIPRASERLEILNYFNPPIQAEEREQVLQSVAQKTHAFNGDDLANLLQNSKQILRKRLRREGLGREAAGEQFLTEQDIEQALRITRPTAMHDINLKPPTVHWQDIGGQEDIKKVLRRMIDFTKGPHPAIGRIIRQPPKGLLLYGPPGCSKTLSAQAMATESGFNFFAVKGAELLNMYVGESERAIRTLFERARAASPAIIFFDEIDSIGGQRSGAGTSASSRSASSVNTITTLLTEMDGFETLKGVLVLAATNRPWAIDPALLRPGRFDQVLYVGPPNQEAREAILRVNLRGLAVSSDVDIPELARLADGLSGAEMKALCSEAGQAVLDRHDDLEENSAAEIAMDDLLNALKTTSKNITKQMVDEYEQWSKKFKRA